MIDLEEALTAKDILFVDGSARNEVSDHCHYIFGEHFASLDPDVVTNTSNLFTKLGAIIGNRKSRTIPEVAEELGYFQEGLLRTYSHLCASNTSKELDLLVKDGKFEGISDARKVRDSNRELYENLMFRVNYCVNRFRDRAVRIVDPGYDAFVEVLSALDKVAGLKKCTRFSLRKHQTPNSSDTDERLLTAAYWASMFSTKSTGILTRDTDFIKMLVFATSILGSKEFYPHNREFRNALHDNPINVYFRANENHCEDFTSRTTKYQTGFTICRASPEDTARIKQEIFEFWKDFSGYAKEVGIKFNA